MAGLKAVKSLILCGLRGLEVLQLHLTPPRFAPAPERIYGPPLEAWFEGDKRDVFPILVLRFTLGLFRQALAGFQVEVGEHVSLSDD